MGGDTLLAGNHLYRYSGDGHSWEWTFIRSVESKINVNIDKNDLDQFHTDQFYIAFYGANSYINGIKDDSVFIIPFNFRNIAPINSITNQ